MTRAGYTIAITRFVRRPRRDLPLAVAAVRRSSSPVTCLPTRTASASHWMPLDGIRSARLMREWRVLYVVDDHRRTVTVRAVVHRRDAYRPH